MLLTSIAVAALLTPLPAPAPTARILGPTVATLDGHGKLPWFAGSFDELLAKAKASNQIIFIDFWTDWCVWCKRLDSGAFSDDSVVAEMKDVLCYSVDAESETGAPLAQRFKVRGYPALIVLSPDGSVRDNIGGYLTPDQFKTEIQRVRSDKGTVGELRRQVAQDAKNVDVHYKLMQKLQALGDEEGATEIRATIEKLDPDGKSMPMRRFAFEKLMSEIDAGWNASQTLDVDKVVAFLEKETYPEILFQGWYSVYKMHGFLAQDLGQKGQADKAKEHEIASSQALRLLWKYCGKDERASIGSQIALDFFQRRENISPEEKAFALEVAKGAHAVAPDNPATVGALACCLFMNGSKAEALVHIQRAIELEPANKNWPERLAEFQAGG